MEIKTGEGVPDFVLMEHLTEDATWQNLKLRFSKDIIYVR
jgi:myosin heavy subunit